jgi:tetratricopeptide (TPR) repeat protein
MDKQSPNLALKHQRSIPQLDAPLEFQVWLIDAQKRSEVSEILAALGNIKGDLSLLRRAIVCYHSENLEEDFRVFVRQCIYSKDKIIEGYAKALLGYDYLRTAFSQGQTYELESTIEVIPMLEKVLKEFMLQEPTPFKREAESAVRATLASAYIRNKQLIEGEQEAAEALFLAKELKAPLSIVRARQRLISINYHEGKLHQTVALLLSRSEEEKSFNNFTSLQDDITLATTYAQLGNYEKCLTSLRSLREMYTAPLVSALLQLHECIAGTAGLAGDIVRNDAGSKPVMWLVEALRFMLECDGLPRLNLHKSSREQLLKLVLSVTEDVFLYDNWWRAMRAWIRAVALSKLGEFRKALDEITHAPKPQDEDLALRVLIAGTTLELALKLPLAIYNIKAQDPERELVTVFDEAEQTPFASRSGLAKLLQRWHPLAAAYASIMPKGIPELFRATDSVLHLGTINHIYGATVPPSFACELILRSLDFDLPFERNFLQARLNKRDRNRREELFSSLYGNVPFWKPAISIIPLIYGLAQAGENKVLYQDIALSLILTYGIVPKTEAFYEYAPFLPQLAEATHKLLSHNYTPKGFAEAIKNLA